MLRLCFIYGAECHHFCSQQQRNREEVDPGHEQGNRAKQGAVALEVREARVEREDVGQDFEHDSGGQRSLPQVRELEAPLHVREHRVYAGEEQERGDQAHRGPDDERREAAERKAAEELLHHRPGGSADDYDNHQGREDEDHHDVDQLLDDEVAALYLKDRLKDGGDGSADVGPSPENSHETNDPE